jgi:hypothetical protein
MEINGRVLMKRVFAILCAAVIAVFVTACSGEGSNTVVSSSASSSVSTTEQKIYSDSIMDVYFVKKHTMPGINGEMFIDLTVNNKSDKEITVTLADGYFNDSMVTFGSGTPLNILPNKKGSNSFVGKYDGTAESIKKTGFKILIMGKDSASLETTKNIEIKF